MWLAILAMTAMCSISVAGQQADPSDLKVLTFEETGRDDLPYVQLVHTVQTMLGLPALPQDFVASSASFTKQRGGDAVNPAAPRRVGESRLGPAVWLDSIIQWRGTSASRDGASRAAPSPARPLQTEDRSPRAEADAKVDDSTGMGAGTENAPVSDTDRQVGSPGSDSADGITVTSPLVTPAEATADGFDVDLTLLGISGADVSVRSSAEADGVHGYDGDDQITNESTIDVDATSTATAGQVTLNLFDFAFADTTLSAWAGADGIDAGRGNDRVVNDGTIDAHAQSTATGTTVNVQMLDALGTSLNSTIESTAIARGIEGSTGDDDITNNYEIFVNADASITGTSWSGEVIGNPSIVNAKDAEATATGLSGGAGQDTMTNNGILDVEARADTWFLDGNLHLVSTDIVAVDMWIQSLARATGMDGGWGNDTLINNGPVLLTAQAQTDTWTVSIVPVTIDNLVAGPDIDGSSIAAAETIGMAGGRGDDVLKNFSEIQLFSDSDVTVVEGEVSVIGSVTTTAATRSWAKTTGMDGGDGNDYLENGGGVPGGIHVTADADGVATSASAAIRVVPVIPTGLVLPFANAGAVAEATAIGMNGGSGNDTLKNSSIITGISDAEMTSVEVTAHIGIQGGGDDPSETAVGVLSAAPPAHESSQWDPFEVGGADASTARRATAIGMNGGSGNDTITNTETGAINVTADTRSTAVKVNASLAVDLGLARQPEPESTQESDPADVPVDWIIPATNQLTVNSHATGIAAGAGTDSITNQGTVSATTNATSEHTHVKVNINIPATPLGVLGLGFGVDTDANSQASSVGLSGGGGADTITNEGEVYVRANSTSNTVGVEFNTTVAIPALWWVVSNSDTNTNAIAVGIHGDDPAGEGAAANDTIINEHTVDVKADASSASTSISAILGGLAWAQLSTNADAIAAGIDGGAGDDQVSNSGEVLVVSDASGTGVAVDLAVVGGAITRADTHINATAEGIRGDAGSDLLINEEGGTIMSMATSTTNVTAVDVVAGGATVGVIGTEASAVASGITGGAGEDTVINRGSVQAISDATATAQSVEVSIMGGASVGVAGTNASAGSSGITGDAGNDYLEWLGSVSATAESEVEAVLVTYVTVGAALGFANTESLASALGISGGEGNDQFLGHGVIIADATATSGVVSVDVAGVDVALGVAGATLSAETTGADGGAGNDVIDIRETVDATALAETHTTGVVINLAGAGVQVMDANVGADVTGLSGGEGDDWISSASTITADSDAMGHSVAVTGNLLGAAVDSADRTITARTSGIDGGDGADTLINTETGVVDADALASVDGASVVVELIGAAVDGASTHAEATTVGISGGNGLDAIQNDGSIYADAIATNEGAAVDVNIGIGASVFDGSTTATATAAGIDGGDGGGVIMSHGQVDVLADAKAQTVSVNVEGLIGASVGLATGTIATAEATGIKSGDGDDTITWSERLDVESMAEAIATTVGWTTIGMTVGSSGTEASSTATGIRSGAGNDVIVGTGIIDVDATATSSASSVAVDVVGISVVQSTTDIDAVAVGIDGGDGDDGIEIKEALDANARAETTGAGYSVNLIGGGSQKADVTVEATARGATGGTGNDTLINRSMIGLRAEAIGKTNTVDVNLLGGSGGSAALRSNATTVGLSGDAGNDLMLNAGTIKSEALAKATVSDVAFTLAGVSGSDVGSADTVARTDAVGMSGGDGADQITNEGLLDVDGDGELLTGAAASVTIAGVAGTSATLGTSPEATGIDGGQDDDVIRNASTIEVDAGATADLSSGSSFSFAGVSSDAASVTASATATGIEGGSGDDWISNEDTLGVSSTAALTVNSNSSVAFGTATASAQTNATATATGIDGGDGSDIVHNSGTLDATVTTTLTSTQSAYGFGGDPTTDAALDSSSFATGIRTGAGDDWIHNHEGGAITVGATADLTSTGSASATFDFGEVRATAIVGSTVVATGVAGGEGTDTFINDGTVDVVADGLTKTENTSDAGLIIGDAGAESEASADISADGVTLGSGGNVVLNDGGISVTLEDLANARTVHAHTTANGNDFSVDSDAVATATASLDVTLNGITGGDGDNTIVNGGGISVLAAPAVLAESSSDGDGFDGDGNGVSVADVGAENAPVSAIGISVGNGANHIEIEKEGTLNVTAAPAGTATTTVDGDWGGDAVGTTTSNVFATAAGIKAGNGANTIINSGDLLITASASSTAETTATGGAFGSDSATADAMASSTSFGIQAGDGGNQLLNTGVVDVRASATAAATAANATSIEAASATAIRTGSGDDLIINAEDGLLTTRVHGVVGDGVGIDSGAGADLVRLIDESSVLGSVELGAGDDVISFAGTADLAGRILGGAGMDTLRLEDQRTLVMNAADLDSIEQLEAGEGTIELTGSYDFLPGGGLQVSLFEGGNGELVTGGDAVLGGSSSLTVNARPQAYQHGDTFDVLMSNAVIGTFSNEYLTDSFFLDLSLNYLPDIVRVEASVLPFAAAAENRAQQTVAAYLDQIAPTATGDMSTIIGEFQLLSDRPDIDTAFASLSPGSYDSLTRRTGDTIREHGFVLHGRMRSVVAATSPDGSGSAAAISTDVALGALEGGAPDEASFEFWTAGLGRWGDQDAADGFVGYDFTTVGGTLGVDRRLSENFIGGVSLAYLTTNVDLDSGSRADIDGLVGSVYGGWFSDDAWVSGTLSYGQQSYENQRRVVVGMIDRIAASEHDGDFIELSLEAGKRFDLEEEWSLDPFAGLQFVSLDEDGFTETGAGAANLIVDPRTTDSLVAELGVRLGAELHRGSTTYTPYLGAAWVHDFQIDTGSITAGYSGAPGTSFPLAGLDRRENWARLEAGIGLDRDNISAALKYFGELGGGHQSHGLMGSIEIRF